MKRHAIQYSDGSFNVFPDKWPMKKMRQQVEEDSVNIKKPSELPKLVEVEIEVKTVIG